MKVEQLLREGKSSKDFVTLVYKDQDAKVFHIKEGANLIADFLGGAVVDTIIDINGQPFDKYLIITNKQNYLWMPDYPILIDEHGTFAPWKDINRMVRQELVKLVDKKHWYINSELFYKTKQAALLIEYDYRTDVTYIADKTHMWYEPTINEFCIVAYGYNKQLEIKQVTVSDIKRYIKNSPLKLNDDATIDRVDESLICWKVKNGEFTIFAVME